MRTEQICLNSTSCLRALHSAAGWDRVGLYMTTSRVKKKKERMEIKTAASSSWEFLSLGLCCFRWVFHSWTSQCCLMIVAATTVTKWVQQCSIDWNRGNAFKPWVAPSSYIITETIHFLQSQTENLSQCADSLHIWEEFDTAVTFFRLSFYIHY